MSDFESFRREAGGEVMPPNFDELVATSRRRRRTAAASAVVAVVAVVSVVAFGVQGVYGDQPTPVPPAGPTRSTTPTPVPTPGKDTSPSPDESRMLLTPTEIVNHPNSGIAAVAVSESSTDVKAVAWRYCGDRDCSSLRFAVTVTSDNFATSHDVALPDQFWPVVVAVGAETFYAAAGADGRLIDADGTVTKVTLDEGASPLVTGEVFLGQPPNGNNVYLALDPTKGIAHPIPTPQRAGLTSLLQNADGTLVGTAFDYSGRFTRAVMWSTDGGATWNSRLLDIGRSNLMDVVPSTAAGVLAVVQGGSGATGFPFDKIHRSADGGATWQTFDESRGVMGYLGWLLVKPDGSLLVNIEAWSDARHGKPSARPAGLYASAGDDWSSLRFVDSPPDGSDPEAAVSGLALGDYSVTDSGDLRLWLYGYSSNSLLESGPGFDTWTEVPAR
ncbi:MAG: exo-alpha-sialidase [Propionibacteriales bacterium]|nr:exo-alpha-sialidase [Propionibacteriales bacterium]